MILHDKAFTRGTSNSIKRDVGSLEVQIIDTDSYTPFIDYIEQEAGFISGYLREENAKQK